MRMSKMFGWVLFLVALLILILLYRNGMDFQTTVSQILFWK